MRPVLFCSVFLLSVMMSVGSRLGKLEDEVKNLKSFIFTELGYIRVEVKEISNRVEILENITVTQEPNIPNQQLQVGNHKVRVENNKANQVVTAEVENIRKAFTNDKKVLHKLKTDIQGQLRDMEKKIDTHLESLTSEVQHNIKYIHKNISLANASLLDVVKESTANASKFSDNLRIVMAEFAANTSEQLSLRLNETDTKMKQNITTTYRHNKDRLQGFMALADRNISEMMLKADNIVSLIRTNFSEMPTQITLFSLELNSVKQKVEEKFKQITRDITCIKVQNGYYYPCGTKTIRLANASSYRSTGVQGRLEVRHNDEWGTVCDDSFEKELGEIHIRNNGIVVCKSFGSRECEFVTDSGLGKGNGTIWLDDVRCGGGESSFLDCPHRGWGVNNCGHHEDVGIKVWN